MSALVITLLVLGGRPQASLLTEPGSALIARRWQQVTRDKELQVVKLQTRDTGQQASGSPLPSSLEPVWVTTTMYEDKPLFVLLLLQALTVPAGGDPTMKKGVTDSHWTHEKTTITFGF